MVASDHVFIPSGKEATDLVEVQRNSDACDHQNASKAFLSDSSLVADKAILASTSSNWMPGHPSDRSSSESDSRSDRSGKAIVDAGAPHEGLFFVLAYLELRDLLSMQRVCRSLRDAVNGDPLLWRHIRVDRPSSWKLTNEVLAEITAKAQGNLRSLTLKSCWMVTDLGLHKVIDENPRISEICLPGCVHVTADGIVKAVSTLAERAGDGPLPLKRLALHGLKNLTAEHVDILNSMMKRNRQKQMLRYYGCNHSFVRESNHDGVIDVDVCPKCEKVSLIFDCTRKECREKKQHRLVQCRGCSLCIARCDDCGGCLNWYEFGQTFCCDLLCEKCWVELPKCSLCSRSACRRNASHSLVETESGLVCQNCYHSIKNQS